MDSSLGERLKIRRRELELTLAQLSDKCGISPQLISDYENDRKEPGLKNIRALCSALEVYPNYLIEENKYVASSNKENTYGNVLNCYFEALKYSKKDELIIDKDKKEVFIKINDSVLKNALIMMEPYIGKNDFEEAIKNFNINLLSEVEIKD